MKAPTTRESRPLSRVIESMNLRDLQYVEALATTLHFGEAAKRCNVSQSTLSIQIKKLEEMLGTSLFERDARSVRISDVGAQLLPLIIETLRAAEDVRHLAEQLRDPLAGRLRFGAFPTIAPYVLPHIMPRMHAAFPKVQFELIEEKTEVLMDKLLRGDMDAALLALPVEHPRLDAIALFAEPFFLAINDRHPIAKRKLVTLDDMFDLPLLLLDEGHCLRAQSLEFCAGIGKGESQSYRATSLETLRHMVASGAGCTLMPSLAATSSYGIQYVKFADPQPQRHIALVFRSATARRVLFTSMAREIREAIKPIRQLKALAASNRQRHTMAV